MDQKEGIVTRVVDYRDNTKIITVMTNTGSQGLIVKGATNLRSHTFSYTQELIKISFAAKKQYLSSGKLIDSYRNIKLDFNKLSSGLRILEIINALGDHINDYSTFYEFTDQILKNMNELIDHEKLEIIFRIKALFLLGLSPVFFKCVECGTIDNLSGFSLFDGGMKCNDHLTNEDYIYNHDIVSQLRILYAVKLQELITKIDEVECTYLGCDNFLNLFYDHFLGFKSKVKKITGLYV